MPAEAPQFGLRERIRGLFSKKKTEPANEIQSVASVLPEETSPAPPTANENTPTPPTQYLRDQIADLRRTEQSLQAVRQEARKTELQSKEQEACAYILNLVSSKDRETEKWIQEQREQWMEIKYGRKKSLFGLGAGLHKMRRFCDGEYQIPVEETDTRWQKVAKEATNALYHLPTRHKHILKFAGGAGALGLGVLVGAPVLAALGGTFFARGAVESAKKFTQKRMLVGEKGEEKPLVKIGLNEQIELSFVAKQVYLNELIEEFKAESTNEEMNNAQYIEKIEKLIDFIKRAENGEATVEYYKTSDGIKTKIAGSNQSIEGVLIVKAQAGKLLEASSRSQMIFDLLEAGAGIAGGAMAGWGVHAYEVLQAKNLFVSTSGEAAKATGGAGAQIGSIVSEGGKVSKVTMDIAQEGTKVPTGYPMEQFHNVMRGANSTYEFLRSSAETQWLTEQGLTGGTSALQELAKGTITNTKHIQVASKIFGFAQGYIDRIAELSSVAQKMWTIMEWVAGVSAVDQTAKTILTKAAQKEYVKILSGKTEKFDEYKEALGQAKQEIIAIQLQPLASEGEVVAGSTTQPEPATTLPEDSTPPTESVPAEPSTLASATAEGQPVNPAEREVAVPIGDIAKEKFGSGKAWQKKLGASVRHRYKWANATEISIQSTVFVSGEQDKISKLSIQIPGDDTPIVLKKEVEITKFLECFEPKPEEST